MLKNGWYWCDKCGRPLSKHLGVHLGLNHYCGRCAPLPKNGKRPPILTRVRTWFRRWT